MAGKMFRSSTSSVIDRVLKAHRGLRDLRELPVKLEDRRGQRELQVRQVRREPRALREFPEDLELPAPWGRPDQQERMELSARQVTQVRQERREQQVQRELLAQWVRQVLLEVRA